MGRKRHLNESAKQNSNSSPNTSELQKGLVNSGRKENRWNVVSPLHIPVIPTVVDEQTPTPTRLLRSCDEVGLFHEISKSTYTEGYKQQDLPVKLVGEPQAENSSMMTSSQQNAPIPSVIFESTADDNETEDNISATALQHPNSNSFMVSDATDGGPQLMYGMPQEADIPAEAAVVEHSAERPHVQVLLQLPNGVLIPINIPADALAHATIPVMTTSPAITVSSSSVPQPIAPVIVPSTTSPGITSSTKQKLKAAVQHNMQQSHHHQQQQHQPVVNSLSEPNVVKVPQQISSHRVSDSDLLKNLKSSVTSATLSTTLAPSSVMNVSSQSSALSSDDDEESEEKRKKFLESNRAAANRCRQKKKQWINSLEEKTKQLQEVNKDLMNETSQLKKEIAQLRQALAAHKDCAPTMAFISSNI